MHVVDTSWLVALVDADDAHHDAAVAQASSPQPLIIPGPVLAELLQVVHHATRRVSGTAAARAATRTILRHVTALPTATVRTEYRHDDAAELFLRHHDLSYVDAIGVAVAREIRAPLASFDKRQLALMA